MARLLQERRGARNRGNLPRLTLVQILRWADAHHARTGTWPNAKSGTLPEAPHEYWSALDKALQHGLRGLPRGWTLARLLVERRGVRVHLYLTPFRVRTILTWTDAYHRRHGDWPTEHSGVILEAPAETWEHVNWALEQGGRGLPGHSSLARLLARYRGRRNHQALPRLRLAVIRKWAREHLRRTGRRPTHLSGPIPGSGGETWSAVHSALSQGGRGLPGGSSLARALGRGRSPKKDSGS